jgi:hypothetical protein
VVVVQASTSEPAHAKAVMGGLDSGWSSATSTGTINPTSGLNPDGGKQNCRDVKSYQSIASCGGENS